MSRVIETLECPSIPETLFGWTPLVSSSVAQVCLRSWYLVSGSPARLRSGFQDLRWSLARRMGVPMVVVNTRP
jgi:hypothetical protein